MKIKSIITLTQDNIISMRKAAESVMSTIFKIDIKDEDYNIVLKNVKLIIFLGICALAYPKEVDINNCGECSDFLPEEE